METQEQFSWNKRGRSFKYAFSGIIHMFKTQHNAWIHGVLTIFVIAAAIYFDVSIIEWCLLSFAIGLVLIAEIINTSIEKLVDIVSPNYNIAAGKVKDIAAGGVLIAAIVAAIVGLIIFVPQIINLF